MKACKIILVILYVLSIIIKFGKTAQLDGNEQVEHLLGVIIDAVVYGILFKGAGIFDI